jgi:acetyl esterase/lipase
MVLSFLAACSPVTALNTLLVPRDGWHAERGIAYGSDERQRLDVYVPRDAAVSPRPVVVFFYGGSWRSGRREYYRFVGEALTSRGYVAVIPDYRVYPQVRFPDFVDDAARAVAWTINSAGDYGGDPGRVFLMGHSAGAHIAALLLTDPHYLAAAGSERQRVSGFVGLAGPYSFDPLQYRTTRPIFETTPDARATMPYDLVDGGEPPMLLIHGLDDRTVLPINSEAFATRVTAAGGTAEFLAYPDTGHTGIILALARPFRRTGGLLDAADRFLNTRATAGGDEDNRAGTGAAAATGLAKAARPGHALAR